MPQDYSVTIVLTQTGENINMTAVSDPLVENASEIQPVHFMAEKMIGLYFKDYVPLEDENKNEGETTDE